MIARSIHREQLGATAQGARNRLLNICALQGCAAEIPRRHLMCPQHWFEVPPDLRSEVDTTLAMWLGRKDNVRPYLIARLRAIVHVTQLHRGDTRDLEAQLARWQQPYDENAMTNK